MNPLNRIAITLLADAYAHGVIHEEMQHPDVEKALVHLLFVDLMLFGGSRAVGNYKVTASMPHVAPKTNDEVLQNRHVNCLKFHIDRQPQHTRVTEEETLTIIYDSLNEGIREWWYGHERPEKLAVMMDAHWSKFFYDIVHWYEQVANIKLLTGKW